MEIRQDDPRTPAAAALIALHTGEAHAATPDDHAHALGVEVLAAPGVTFWTAWEGDRLLGMAALRALAADHGEIKSMRTAPDALRRGVARAMLAHVVAAARARGYRRLSLETGTAAMFGPANRLYEAAGFVDCAAFGGYAASPHNRFMTRSL